jgi:hypothetical protein
MKQKPGSKEEDLIDAMIRRMNLVYFAQIAGIIAFAFISVFIVESGEKPEDPDLHEVFKIAVPFIAVSSAFVSRFFIYHAS